MKIVCLSSIIDDSFIEEKLLNEPLSTADSNYNYRIITGLDSNIDFPCTLLNYVPIGSYPGYRKIFLSSKVWKKDHRINSLNIGFINITGLKYISMTFNYISKLRAILTHSSEKVYVVCYDLYCPFLLTINYLTRRYPNLISCLVVPFLPEYDIRHNFKEKFKKVFSGSLMKAAAGFDCFVFLTEYMKKKIPTRSYTVVEGIIPDNYVERTKKKIEKDKNSRFTIAYSGRLDKIYHIDLLIEAVQSIHEYDVILQLCGHGDLEESISHICLTDQRIEYLGFLNAAELEDFQKNADILINTRSPEGEYTKYSFPSKTMEYLASGTPVLMYKLPGIPLEYDEYLNYIDGYQSEDIKRSIEKVIKESIDGKAYEKAERGRRFVIEFKNSKAQGKKLVELLKKQ